MARVTIIVERRLAGTMLMKNERRFACDGMNLKTAADGAFFFLAIEMRKVKVIMMLIRVLGVVMLTINDDNEESIFELPKC
jgi:hypothetical protein